MVSVFCRNINSRTRGYDLGAFGIQFCYSFSRKLTYIAYVFFLKNIVRSILVWNLELGTWSLEIGNIFYS